MNSKIYKIFKRINIVKISSNLFLFSKVLESFGYNVPEAELTAFISQLDIDKSGK
jgi:hypothetical protein